jgi:hypothetical protein
LEHGPGAVRVASGVRLKAPAAVIALSLTEPGGRGSDGGWGDAGGTQRQDAEGRQVHLALERTIPGPSPAKLGNEVAATEAPRIRARALEGENCPLQISGRAQFGDLGA